ncbi:MAG: hypothetical protein ABF459_07770, partial [Gluconobacter cerinus]|uniref:hypothetical protein n=1 Tax=Gluconobacter cerinus TaxID=38307 RepID=UPI0039E8059A
PFRCAGLKPSSVDNGASWKVGSIVSAIPCVRNYTPAQACNPLSVLRRLWDSLTPKQKAM